MAQPREAARTDNSAPAPAGKSPNGTTTTPGSGSPLSRFNLANFGRLFAPRPAASSGAGQQAKRPGFSRLLFAMLIFIVAAQFGEYLLFFLAGRFPEWNLIKGTMVADKNVPILGSMTRFTFLYLIFIVALYIGLYRFGVFPKDPFGAKARAQQQRDAAAARTSSGTGSGTRAERRHATRHATTTSTTKAPSARQVAAQARATAPDRNAGANDTEYERVKAALRQRRRRETKR